jgi:predicted small metal-binding protein
MTKELHCRDLGFDCEGVVSAETEEDVLAQVAEHGRQVHGLSDQQLSDPAFLDLARGQIHDQPSQSTTS